LKKREARRLALELIAQRLLRSQHRARTRAVRAVVQVGDLGIERPVPRQIGRGWQACGIAVQGVLRRRRVH
jgi:hypothetical protein